MSNDSFCVIPFKESVDTPNTIMEIGYITKKGMSLSSMAKAYIDEISTYLAGERKEIHP
jgi:hypothetical protein